MNDKILNENEFDYKNNKLLFNIGFRKCKDDEL